MLAMNAFFGVKKKINPTSGFAFDRMLRYIFF